MTALQHSRQALIFVGASSRAHLARAVTRLVVLAIALSSCTQVGGVTQPAALVAAAVPRPAPIVAVMHDPRCGSARAVGAVEDVPTADSASSVEQDEPTNLERAEAELAAQPPGAVESNGAFRAWDHKTPPKYLDRVRERFGLDERERAALAKNGFVVPARLTTDGPTWAYQEIYRSELPLFVSIDSVLHAVYVSNDEAIDRLEAQRLAPALDRALLAMHCALPSAAAAYPEQTAHDLDVYLAVARSLLEGTQVEGAFESDAKEAKSLVDRAMAASDHDLNGTTLFGRQRTIDFTQYQPRGHYAGDSSKEQYFRAVMWLSRLELNLVSRSCRSSQPDPEADPSETPREDVLALALADLAERAHAMDDVAIVEHALTVLAGRREDVSLRDLLGLRAKAGIASLNDPDAAAKLRAAIGDRYPRTVRFQYMPEGTTTLPVIATLLGPRITVDAAALAAVVQPGVAGRTVVHAADVGYALGHDRAKRYLEADLSMYPRLDAQLGAARKEMMGAPIGEDLYSAWFSAVRALSEPARGAVPSFMSTEAYQDLRLDSAIAGFAQLRHDNVLIAAQEYYAGGCEVPDAWVEPAEATYDALVLYAGRLVALERELDPRGELVASSGRMAAVLEVLRTIAHHEVEGRALTDAEKSWLAMVVTMYPATCPTGNGEPEPVDSGWYLDLFPSVETARKPPQLVADYFTGTSVSYVGVANTRFGVFIVDRGGAPRAMVGPVTRAFEHLAPSASVRLDDAAALALPDAERLEPWSRSYVVEERSVAEPKLYLQGFGNDGGATYSIELTSDDGAGSVTLQLLDRHRRPIGTLTKYVGKGKTTFVLPIPMGTYVDGVRLQIGELQRWVIASPQESGLYASFGGQRAPWDPGP